MEPQYWPGNTEGGRGWDRADRGKNQVKSSRLTREVLALENSDDQETRRVECVGIGLMVLLGT